MLKARLIGGCRRHTERAARLPVSWASTSPEPPMRWSPRTIDLPEGERMGLVAEVDLDGDQLGQGEEGGEEHGLAHVGDDVAVQTAHGTEEEQERGGATGPARARIGPGGPDRRARHPLIGAGVAMLNTRFPPSGSAPP